MLIEIVDSDYYSSSNRHLVVDDPNLLPSLYREYRQNLTGPYRTFSDWLVEEKFARHPDDSDYMVYEEGSDSVY